MKYLMMFWGLLAMWNAQPAMGATCEQIMKSAGYTKKDFKMLDDHTIVIMPNLTDQIDVRVMKGLKAPQCDIISLANQLIIDYATTVEINTISVYHLLNQGILKANDIIVPPQKEILKRLGFERRRIISENGRSLWACGLANECVEAELRKDTLESAYIVAKHIYVNCDGESGTLQDAAVHNSGKIEAQEVHGRCIGCRGVLNLGTELTGCESSIIKANIVTGVGYHEGIMNLPDAEIIAQTVKGMGYALEDGIGIRNTGKIRAGDVECCSVHGSECYRDTEEYRDYINGNGRLRHDKGKVSSPVRKKCPETKTK